MIVHGKAKKIPENIVKIISIIQDFVSLGIYKDISRAMQLQNPRHCSDGEELQLGHLLVCFMVKEELYVKKFFFRKRSHRKWDLSSMQEKLR